MPYTIAVVGRPNVGKSTLFNRLLRRNVAITHDLPGVTRDRIYAETKIDDHPAAFIDTGGLELAYADDPVTERGIFEQVAEALAESQAVLMLVDGREGLTALDEQVAAHVRKTDKPVLLVINKIDGAELEDGALAEFSVLGLPMLAVSSAHGFNLSELREHIVDEWLAKAPPEEERGREETGLRIAMLGRPNAGKSSMVNALSGKDRVIVSPVAGTTRDAVDVTMEKNGKRYTFVDTAGVRRKTRLEGSLERFTVVRALKASRRADVTILVVDGEFGLTMQDKKLLGFLDKEKAPFMVCVNKVDLAPEGSLAQVKKHFEDALKLTPWAPILYTSTLTGENLNKILPMAAKIWEQCQIRVTTGQLNRIMREVITRHQPPVVKRRRAKFYYLTQADTAPPTFVFFVNDTELIKPSYERYLEGQLRKSFGLKYAPLKLQFRSSHGEKEK